MSGYLIDTNCVSELTQPAPHPGVLKWFDAADESRLYLSVLTLGEIRKGVAGMPPSKRRNALEAWLDSDLRARFAGRIVDVGEDIADRWGALAAQAKRNGTPLAIIDGLLAATALHLNLTMVTRNLADFAPGAVPVVNPWLV